LPEGLLVRLEGLPPAHPRLGRGRRLKGARAARLARLVDVDEREEAETREEQDDDRQDGEPRRAGRLLDDREDPRSPHRRELAEHGARAVELGREFDYHRSTTDLAWKGDQAIGGCSGDGRLRALQRPEKAGGDPFGPPAWMGSLWEDSGLRHLAYISAFSVHIAIHTKAHI